VVSSERVKGLQWIYEAIIPFLKRKEKYPSTVAVVIFFVLSFVV
jgi:hypothetical protein